MANIVRYQNIKARTYLRPYFNFKKGAKNTYKGLPSYNTMTPSEKDELYKNLLNASNANLQAFQRFLHPINNSTMGGNGMRPITPVPYPSINNGKPPAPPMPTNGNATVVMGNGKTESVPVYNVTRSEFQTLKNNVNQLKSRTGLGGAALNTGAYLGGGAVAGAKAAGKGVMYVGKGVGKAAGYVGSGIAKGAQEFGRGVGKGVNATVRGVRGAGHSAAMFSRFAPPNYNRVLANNYSNSLRTKSMQNKTPFVKLSGLSNAELRNLTGANYNAVKRALKVNSGKWFGRRY